MPHSHHPCRIACLPLCSCVPQEQLPAAIQTLADPLLNPIKAAMQQFTPNLGAAGQTTLAAQLPLFDRLATLFDSVPVQHAPAASILLQVRLTGGLLLLHLFTLTAWSCEGLVVRSSLERQSMEGGSSQPGTAVTRTHTQSVY